MQYAVRSTQHTAYSIQHTDAGRAEFTRDSTGTAINVTRFCRPLVGFWRTVKKKTPEFFVGTEFSPVFF